MKTHYDSILSTVLAIALASTPGLSFADWLYDSAAKTVTDGAWVFSVTEKEGELTLKGDASGLDPVPETLDLSGAVAGDGDYSYSIVAIGSGFASSAMKKGLVHLILPDTLRSMGGWSFSGCSALETVTPFLPDSLESMAGEVFMSCGKLKGDLRITNPALQTINYWTFKYASSITSAYLPYVKVIGDQAFLQTSVTNVVLSPELESIGSQTFQGCGSPLVITPLFPESIKKIGNQAFFSWSKNLQGPVVFPPEPIDLTGSANLFMMDAPLDFYFPKKAPIKEKLAPTVFQARKPDQVRRVLHGSLRLDPKGWAALTEPLTAEDRAREDFPGPKTFGVLVLNGIRYFCVDYTSPYDPKGIVLLLR